MRIYEPRRSFDKMCTQQITLYWQDSPSNLSDYLEIPDNRTPKNIRLSNNQQTTNFLIARS